LESINRTVAYAQDIAQVTLDRWPTEPASTGRPVGRRITTPPGAMD